MGRIYLHKGVSARDAREIASKNTEGQNLVLIGRAISPQNWRNPKTSLLTSVQRIPIEKGPLLGSLVTSLLCMDAGQQRSLFADSGPENLLSPRLYQSTLLKLFERPPAKETLTPTT